MEDTRKQSANAVTVTSLMMQGGRIEESPQAARPEGHMAERWQKLSHITAWQAVPVSNSRSDAQREGTIIQGKREGSPSSSCWHHHPG